MNLIYAEQDELDVGFSACSALTHSTTLLVGPVQTLRCRNLLRAADTEVHMELGSS